MKKIIILIVPVMFTLSLRAQNLNPEVHVTNEYQTRLEDVSKQGPELAIPDSLLRFDYHFDYSVFDSPYKGAYEFSPYSVTITPDPKSYDGKKLYVSAGAGYTLRPELDVVWAAVDNKRFALDVFGSAKGFVGQYRDVMPGYFYLAEKQMFDGYDFRTAAGLDARFSLGRVNFQAEAGYDGIYTRHEVYHSDNCHAPYAQLRFGYDTHNVMAYTGGVTYRYIYDWLNGSSPVFDHEFLTDLTVSAHPSEEYRINVDFTLASNSFYTAGNVHPHLIFQLGVFDIDAGFHAGWVPGQFSVSPDIQASIHLLKDYLKVYAGAVGEDHYMSYWDYKNRAHHYYISYCDPKPVREIADLYLGVDGHADFGLQYDVRAGYRFLKDAPFWAIDDRGMECLAFQECGMFHADLAVSWASERFNLDSNVRLSKIPDGLPSNVFEPSLVTGTLKGTYNWMKRIFAGVSVDFASDRKASPEVKPSPHIPGYVNVGVSGEYRHSRHLSFWLKGYNLLNHDVRVCPLYSEYGPSVTLGATFSL